MLAAVTIAFVLDLTVVSHLQHLVAQQQLTNEFRAQLDDGTAPVSEGRPAEDDPQNGEEAKPVLLSDGDPVGLLEIPAIGVREIVVEGTSSGALMAGPGHRRDTPLPGQVGQSILMGRSAAFGGPFSRIQELAPGDRISVRTGQGLHYFSVIGIRYAGDPQPPRVQSGESRLVLVTARGAPYAPAGAVYVDAQLTSSPQDRGSRQTTIASLPAADFVLATDTSRVWGLIFALQFLVAVELSAFAAWRRVGARKVWIVFVPLAVLASLLVATQVTLLLPNLL
jgi:LPXTG-site transpeptidase (sortase) family protein